MKDAALASVAWSFIVILTAPHQLASAGLRGSSVTMEPNASVYRSGAVIAYRQWIRASPNDASVLYFYQQRSPNGSFSEIGLFEVPILEAEGIFALEAFPPPLSNHFFNVSLERSASSHIISFFFRLSCETSRGFGSRLTTKSKNRSELLAYQTFTVLAIDSFELDHSYRVLQFGDVVKATCRLRKCFSHVRSQELAAALIGQFQIFATNQTEDEPIEVTGDFTKSTVRDVDQVKYVVSKVFVVPCADLSLVCTMDDTAADVPLKRLTAKTNTRFCVSPMFSVAVRSPAGRILNSLDSVDINEKWIVTCKALVNDADVNMLSLDGPVRDIVSKTPKETQDEDIFLVQLDATFVLEDCAMFGQPIQCQTRHEVFNMSIAPRVCKTDVLKFSVEVFNEKTLARFPFKSFAQLGDEDSLIITCVIRVPKLEGLRKIQILDAQMRPLKVKSVTKEDVIKRYVITLTAFIPRAMVQFQEPHVYVCSVDHAWEEEDVISHRIRLHKEGRRPPSWTAVLVLLAMVVAVFGALMSRGSIRLCRKRPVNIEELWERQKLLYGGDEELLFEQKVAKRNHLPLRG